MMRLAAALCWLALIVVPTVVHAAPPTLSHVLPYAVAPGATTKLTCYGDGLVEASLWSNLSGAEFKRVDSGKSDNKATSGKEATFECRVPADAVPGVYGLRVTTPTGATNLRLFMVDDLSTTREDVSNKSVAKAQKLAWPTAVDGVYEAETYDNYRIHCRAGQRLSVEAVARRLGSSLDPVIRFLDAAGHELAYADDDESTGADGRFTYRIQKTGDYVIEVRDIRYAGSGQHRYRLRIGDFPLLAAPHPMGVQVGTTSLVEPLGFDVGPLVAQRTAVPADFAGKQWPLAVRYAHKQGSAFAMLTVSHGVEQTEVEPNHDREEASPLVLTGAVNGRFEQPNDRDQFAFDAKKGERLSFKGYTRDCGSPADLFLRIFDQDGKVLAEAEDAGMEEGVLEFTVPADGKYFLSAEDLLSRGGPQYSYRIEIAPAKPSFTLTTDAEKLDIPQGGVAKTKVSTVRSGYTGPIKLSLVVKSGAGEFTATGTIPEKKNDGTLVVTAPESIPVGTFVNAVVVGEASDKNVKDPIRAVALAIPAFKTSLGGLTNPPLALAENLAISVGPKAGDFLKVSAAKSVTLPQLVGKATLAVKVEKLDKFDDVVTLAVEGLPPGVEAVPGAKIEKGKNEATIELTCAPTSAPVEHAFRVVAAATFNDQPKKYTSDDVLLRIAPPIETSAATVAPLEPGQKRKVKISVVRHGDKPEAVTLRWKSLPSGVQSAAEVVVPADQNEVEVELAAAERAPLGPGAGRLTATTAIGGRKVTLDVGTVAIEIVPGAPKQTAAK